MATFYHESCRSQKEVMWMIIKGNLILQKHCKRNAMLTLRNIQLCFPYLLLRWNQSPWNHRASDAPIYHLSLCTRIRFCENLSDPTIFHLNHYFHLHVCPCFCSFVRSSVRHTSAFHPINSSRCLNSLIKVAPYVLGVDP